MTRIIMHCSLVFALAGILSAAGQETTEAEAPKYSISSTPESQPSGPNFIFESSTKRSGLDLSKSMSTEGPSYQTSYSSDEPDETKPTQASSPENKSTSVEKDTTTLSNNSTGDESMVKSSQTYSPSNDTNTQQASTNSDKTAKNKTSPKPETEGPGMVRESDARENGTSESGRNTTSFESFSSEKQQEDHSSTSPITHSTSSEMEKAKSSISNNTPHDNIEELSPKSEEENSSSSAPEESEMSSNKSEKTSAMQEIKEEAASQETHLDGEKKSSIPPKSATRKRSLNETSSTKSSDGVNDTSTHSGTDSTVTELLNLIPTVNTKKELNDNLTLDPGNGNAMDVHFSDALTSTLASNAQYSAITTDVHTLTTEQSVSVSSEREDLNSNENSVEKSTKGILEASTKYDSNNGNIPDIPSHVYTATQKAEIYSLENNTAGHMSLESLHEVEDIPQGSSPTSPEKLLKYQPVTLDGIHSNDLNFAKPTAPGVTFDPNGMTNNNPQDPDSVTFSVEDKGLDQMLSDSHLAHSEKETESETDHELESLAKEMNHSLHETTGSKVFNESHFASDKNESPTLSSPELLPHDFPDSESVISMHNMAMETTLTPKLNNAFKKDMATMPPSVQISKSTSVPKDDTEGMMNDSPHVDDTEGMMNDSPHIDDSDHLESKPTNQPSDSSMKVVKDGSVELMNVHTKFSASSSGDVKGINMSSDSHALLENGTDNSFIELQTEQSEIRPVKVISPQDQSLSTSLAPDSSSMASSSSMVVTQAGSQIATQADAGLAHNTSIDTSSPIILPNPAPSLVDNNDHFELSTLLAKSELISPIPESVETESKGNETAGELNSTIAGVAVKTSVSVSLPLSKNSNVSNVTQDLPESSMKDVNSSQSVSVSPVPISLLNSDSETTNDTRSSEDTTDAPTTIPPTTKPPVMKLWPKVPGRNNAGPKTRKPFLQTSKRPSSTPGSSISIFSQRKTRINSITSSTTPIPAIKLSTIRIHYASRVPGLVPKGELVFSLEPVTTTVPTTTTEEYYSEEPFTDQTHVPSVSSDDDVTLMKVAGYIVVEKGLRWNEQLDNRHSPAYKDKANLMHLQLERLFRTSPIASRLWKIEVDGFSGIRNSNSVAVDFFLYLIKSKDEIATEHLEAVFHEKLKNNTFNRFRVDTTKTAFEMIQEEPLNKPTPSPENTVEPPIPQWAIAVIVIGAASLIFIVLFAAVTMYGRHHMRRRYSSKLSEEDIDRSGDWENKMAEAYENLAADTIYDAEDLHGDTYKKPRRIATFHGRPTGPKPCDSWSSSDWTTQPRRQRPHVHRIVF